MYVIFATYVCVNVSVYVCAYVCLGLKWIAIFLQVTATAELTDCY